jgi:hypothetical protein
LVVFEYINILNELVKNFLTLIVILFVSGLSAQNSEVLSNYQKVLYTVDNIQVAPEFPGGENKFNEFVKTNFTNLKAKKGTEISISFIVEMDGTISNVEIISDDNVGSGKELKRVLEISPKWLQGEHEGYHVRTKINYIFKV